MAGDNSHDEVMSESERPRDANRLRLDALKRAVRAAPTNAAARLALAEVYRELGMPDQAGRWGALSDGWATDVELDRFARQLGASGIGPDNIRPFLLLPAGAKLPASLEALVAGPAATYQRELATKRRAEWVDTPSLRIAQRVVDVFAVAAAICSLGTVLIVYFWTVGGVEVSPTFARVAGAIVLLLAVIASIAFATVLRIRRRNRIVPGEPSVYTTDRE